MGEKMANIRIGELVRSVSGHDQGDYLLVIRRDGNYLWLCDGKRRKADQCKKKKQKHVKTTGLVCDWIRTAPEKVNNTSVRKTIKEMQKILEQRR